MNLAFASLIFCLLCIDYSCGGPNFKITQCSNSTGDNSNGICDSCVKYDHNKDLKFCSSKLQLCKFEFNSTNFTWRYNKTFCEADSISIVLYNENIRDNRFVEGCCGVKLEQMSCQPKHCEPSEQLVYFVQDKNKKMLCAHQYYHTIKCPVREQQQPKDFIWYCANGTAEQQDFRKRFNATCFVYDKLNDKYTFRDEVHTEYTSQKGFITHKKSGMWNAFKEACIFYLNEETVLKYAHNSSGKAVDLLFQRQAFDMRTLPKEFVDNCTIQKFGNASSFFDMTSPTTDYICMRKWPGFQFRCIEPEVTKAVDNRPEVSANTEFTFIVVIVAVVGMIFLAFLVYFGFPVCAVQVKLFKDTKKIDPVTQGMFNRSDLKYIFVDSKEKEIYESGFAVQAVQHPCKETNIPPLSSQAVSDAPAAPNAFQEGNGCLTEGYCRKDDIGVNVAAETQAFVDSGITSSVSRRSSDSQTSLASNNSGPLSPDSGIPGSESKFEFGDSVCVKQMNNKDLGLVDFGPQCLSASANSFTPLAVKKNLQSPFNEVKLLFPSSTVNQTQQQVVQTGEYLPKM